MNSKRITLSICFIIMFLCPNLIYAQNSYEEELKQKLNQEIPLGKSMYSGRGIDDWLICKGKWEATGETVKYIGVSDPSKEYGAIVHKSERLWNGFLETSLIFPELFLKNDKSNICFMVSYNPVTDDRYQFCFGGFRDDKKLAYTLSDIEWKGGRNVGDRIAYSGSWSDLVPNFEYRLRIDIHDGQGDFIINGIKVFSEELPRNMYSDFIGILVHGTIPIELKSFHVSASDPIELIKKQW